MQRRGRTVGDVRLDDGEHGPAEAGADDPAAEHAVGALRERHELVEEPWLWIVIGLVVAGGAAAVAGWYADDQAQLRPESPQVVRF